MQLNSLLLTTSKRERERERGHCLQQQQHNRMVHGSSYVFSYPCGFDDPCVSFSWDVTPQLRPCIYCEHRCNCSGLVLAGSADFKSELMTSDLFDPRLLKAVVKTVDVSYGGESGFNQAIELSVEALSSVKLVQEKKLLQKYFDEISQVYCVVHGCFLHFIIPFFFLWGL